MFPLLTELALWLTQLSEPLTLLLLGAILLTIGTVRRRASTKLLRRRIRRNVSAPALTAQRHST
jgi:hypothetical protein